MQRKYLMPDSSSLSFTDTCLIQAVYQQCCPVAQTFGNPQKLGNYMASFGLLSSSEHHFISVSIHLQLFVPFYNERIYSYSMSLLPVFLHPPITKMGHLLCMQN